MGSLGRDRASARERSWLAAEEEAQSRSGPVMELPCYPGDWFMALRPPNPVQAYHREQTAQEERFGTRIWRS